MIEDNASEAALISAALALQPEVQVIGAPSLPEALERLQAPSAKVALAIVGRKALNDSTGELVGRLGAKCVPVVAIAADVSAAVRQRALDVGVREIHERPSEWRPYAELIESLVGRFIRRDSPQRPDRTS